MTISGHMRSVKREEEEARALGEKVGREILESIEGRDIINMAVALGQVLNTLSEGINEPSCDQLLHQWAIDHYWEPRITESYKVFTEAHSLLCEKETTEENRFIHGDIDYGSWAGFLDDNTKFIVIHSYVTCDDNDVWFFFADQLHFHCRKMTIKQAKKIVRQGVFKVYGDNRDPGYCFTIDTFLSSRTKDTLGCYYNTRWSLYQLDYLFEALSA